MRKQIKALASKVTQCIGMDLSQGMVNEYNTLVSNQGIPPSEMHAVVGNLLDPSDPSPPSLAGDEFFNFDIAAVGLGFHHFSDPTFAATQLVKRLKKGGVLLIIDFLPHAPLPKDEGQTAAHTVAHAGFSEEDVKTMFETAGAGEGFEYLEIGQGIVFHGVKEGGETMKRSVFFARGVKL
jgi:SAM-dependent methyltransferase